MEILILILSIVTVALIIGISMISFAVAIQSLKRVMLLEEKYPLKPKTKIK